MPEFLNRPSLQLNTALKNEKCAIFTQCGQLLWYSPAWGYEDVPDFLGRGWIEFVHIDDIHLALHYLREPEIQVCSFRVVLPICSQTAIITCSKHCYRYENLVFGDISLIHSLLPAPPTFI